jgi:hypothetical protein
MYFQAKNTSTTTITNRLILQFATMCQRINLIQKLKLLAEVPRYDLYYSLTPHPFKCESPLA